MRKILLLPLLLLFAVSLFGQKSGKNDISIGVLTQGDFYIFNGARQYYLFGDYRRSYKNFFARVRVSYFTQSYGGTIDDNIGTDTSKITYLWLEAGNNANFQFRDKKFLHPKAGLKSLGTQLVNLTNIDINVWLGYYFKLGKQKRLQIEPSLGFTAYYFRDDLFWLISPLQFGDNVQNQSIPDRQTALFNTTRGVVWGPEADITFRYYLKKRYSVGLNVIGGVNDYFDTFYVGAFIGFNF